MPAYWIARAHINDAVSYKRYTDLVPAILAEYGGRVLARGGRYRTLEGEAKYERHVVVEFPSLERAIECHRSEAYQAARRHRMDGVGDNQLVIVDGGDATDLADP